MKRSGASTLFASVLGAWNGGNEEDYSHIRIHDEEDFDAEHYQPQQHFDMKVASSSITAPRQPATPIERRDRRRSSLVSSTSSLESISESEYESESEAESEASFIQTPPTPSALSLFEIEANRVQSSGLLSPLNKPTYMPSAHKPFTAKNAQIAVVVGDDSDSYFPQQPARRSSSSSSLISIAEELEEEDDEDVLLEAVTEIQPWASRVPPVVAARFARTKPAAPVFTLSPAGPLRRPGLPRRDTPRESSKLQARPIAPSKNFTSTLTALPPRASLAHYELPPRSTRRSGLFANDDDDEADFSVDGAQQAIGLGLLQVQQVKVWRSVFSRNEYVLA